MHPRSQAASVPNLFRAVAECTQPYGPPATVAAVRSLQAYLSDDSCVDSVYKAILARACAEPQSEAVIAKCIALVRQYAARHPPSAAVLAAIAATCQDLAAALPASSSVQKSLLYLESSVTRTADTLQGNKRLAKISARSVGSNASSKGAWPHTAANGDLARSSGSARAVAAAATAAAAGSSVHSSTSEDVLGALQAKAAAVPSVWGSADQQQQQHMQRQQQGEQGWPHQAVADAQAAAAAAAAAAEEIGVRVVPSEPVLPGWTFQPSALQELWLADPEEEADLDWSARAPQLSPSLVPLVDGLPGMEELNPLSCQHIVDAISSADVSTQLRQLQEITEVRRLQCGVTPELLEQLMQQSQANRGRRLFQPLPYTQQEQADVLSSDVAAVVEIMCGKPSPTAPSAITGAVGLDDPDAYWQQPLVGSGASAPQQPLLLLYQQTSNLGGPQQQQQRHTESIGQISSCILVKMVVDLWLSVGGAAAFPLVLRMLQQALYQLQPQYRARAFDIVYNLALHGSMLMPSVTSPPPSPRVQAQRGRMAQPTALGVVLSPLQQAEGQQQQQQLYGAAGSPGGLQQSPGSGYSRDDAPGMQPSPPQSPSAHTTAHQQYQQHSPGVVSPAAGGQQQPGGLPPSSPQVEASPRARSRLSRSQIGWMAPNGSRSGPHQHQHHQQQQHGQAGLGRAASSSNSQGGSFPAATTAAGDDGRGAAAGMAAVQEGVGSDAGSGSTAGVSVPVEVAWEAWLHQLLFELLLMLSMMDEPCEAVWQAALGCLLQLTTQSGHWVAASLSQLPPAAAAALLDACVTFHWSPELHSRLVQMAVNLLYLTDSTTGHAAVHEESSFRQQASQQEGGAAHVQQQHQGLPQQQQLRAGLKLADDSAAALTSPEDVSVTLDTLVGSRAGLRSHSHKGSEAAAAGWAAGADLTAAAGSKGSARAAQSEDGDASSTVHHSCSGDEQGNEDCQHSQMGELDLPWQLHAGPVDEQQLAAFGGHAKLLQHFCHASSVEAQRTLLVPLLQVLMPPDAPDTAQLAVLQALCARPACLAALQAAVSAGLPGWSTCVLTAVQQQLGTEGLDVPLLSDLLLHLEHLSIQRMAVPAAVGGIAAASSSSGSAGGSTAEPGQQQGQSQAGVGQQEQQQQQQVLLQLPAEVQLAVQLTLRQLRGDLPAQARPGLQPSGSTSYQVPAEAQGSWKALRALCWCDDDLARLASRHWLQQLLAVTLQQSLKGAILLPLPGVQQSTAAPSDSTAAAAKSAAVVAACELWSEVLQQLVAHCPRGPELLVDALQLHMMACKMHMHHMPQQQQQQQQGVSSSQQQQQQDHQQQRQRAAAARECVQAWAFVCQWVMQARVANSQAALTRLAAIAHSMSCVFGIPEWPEVAGVAAAAVAAGSNPTAAAADAAASACGQLATAAAAVDASTDSLAGLVAVTCSRDSEGGFLKGVPPPEPSAEPSALARLWAGTGAAAGQASWHEGSAGHDAAAGAAAATAAAAALAAAEGVCWPQAFLTGCSLLIQQLAQVLSGASLALLLVRLLQCRPPSRAADRGFHGRPCSSRLAPGGGSATAGADGQTGVLPCPVLYPWSDGRQDLQLGLVLMLISSCSSDAESFAEIGLEAASQQVLSGCTDPRVCLFVSQFMLEHLMQHQQDRYWTALRQLVSAAQQANDERLLGNPFLQLVTLLSDTQQKQPAGPKGPLARV